MRHSFGSKARRAARFLRPITNSLHIKQRRTIAQRTLRPDPPPGRDHAKIAQAEDRVAHVGEYQSQTVDPHTREIRLDIVDGGSVPLDVPRTADMGVSEPTLRR